MRQFCRGCWGQRVSCPSSGPAQHPHRLPALWLQTKMQEDLSELSNPGHVIPSPQTQLGKQNVLGFLGQSFYFRYAVCFSDFLKWASLPEKPQRSLPTRGAEGLLQPRPRHGPGKNPRPGMALAWTSSHRPVLKAAKEYEPAENRVIFM